MEVPPLGKVLYIQTYVPTAERIRAESVLEIKTKEDLESEALGVKDLSHRCLTCDCEMEYCLGHSGHMELPIPVFNVLYTKQLLSILHCICLYCQRLRLPITDPQYARIHALPAKERLAELETASKPYKRCGNVPAPFLAELSMDQLLDPELTVGQLDLPADLEEAAGGPQARVTGCGQNHPAFQKDNKDFTGIRIVIPLTDADYEAFQADAHWEPPYITPDQLYMALQSLDDEVMHMLGCSQWNAPHAMMWDAFPVSSLNTRPKHSYAGLGNHRKRRDYHDWTEFYRTIFKVKEELADMLLTKQDRVNLCRYRYKNDIISRKPAVCFEYGHLKSEEKERMKKKVKREESVSTGMGPVEGLWQELNNNIAAFTSNRDVHLKLYKKGSSFGKPPVNILARFKGQKTGRWRGNIVARRVNQAARGVLDGDIYLHPSEVGVPRLMARGLTVRERIHRYNIQKVQQWVLNGPETHPGANYLVMLVDGHEREIDLAHHPNRRTLDLNQAVAVLRHLHDGDWVLLNRHPTLHRPSMMSYRVKVIDGYAIRLHYAVFNPLGADCDGDEVNLYVPQTPLAIVESQEINAVRNHVTKDGKVWIKFIQNAVVGAYLLSQREQLTYQQAQNLLTQAPALAARLGCHPPAWWWTDRPPQDDLPFCTGRQMISLLFPPDFTVDVKDKLIIRQGQLVSGVLNDSALNGPQGILAHLYRDYADRELTLRCLHEGYQLFQAYLNVVGFSAGYDDMAIDDEVMTTAATQGESHPFYDFHIKFQEIKQHLQALDRYVDGTLWQYHPEHQRPEIEHNITQHMDRIQAASMEVVYRYHQYRQQLERGANGFLHMIDSGAKGNKNVLNQLCGLVGQVFVMFSRFPEVSAHFHPRQRKLQAHGWITDTVSTGVGLVGLISEAHATAESVIIKNKSTAISGYTMRRMSSVLMSVICDMYGRVVDHDGRVLMNHYGGDGYDPQVLASCKVRCLRWTPVQWRQRWDWTTWLVNPTLRDLWTAQQQSPTLTTQWAETGQQLRQVTQMLRTRWSRNPKAPQPFVTRVPFAWSHLLARCVHRPDRVTGTPLTPFDAWQWAQALWTRLVAETWIVPEHLAQRLLFWDWCGPFSVVVEHQLTRPDLHWLATEMWTLFRRARVQHGEAVGMNGTQCTGEPYTQLALKAPHVSGKSATTIGGTQRMKEMIEADFTHAAMTVVLKPTVKTATQAELFGLQLLRTTFKDILAAYPTYTFRTCATTNPQGKRITLRYARFVMVIDPTKAIARTVSLRRVAERISRHLRLSPKYFRVSRMLPNQPTWTLQFDFPCQLPIWEALTKTLRKLKMIPSPTLMADTILKNLYDGLVIHGLRRIENFTVEQVEWGPKDTRWHVVTQGSALARVMGMPQVDATRTTCNDVHEINRVLGLHAAMVMLQREFNLVLMGKSDPRHIELIAKYMTSDLLVKGFKVSPAQDKMQKGHNYTAAQMGPHMPPTQRAAYEQTCTQMVQYCAQGEIDTCPTVSGSVLANSLIQAGTGYGLHIMPQRGVDVPERALQQFQNQPTQLCSYVFSPKVDGVRLFWILFQRVLPTRKMRRLSAFMGRDNQFYACPEGPPTTFRRAEALWHGTILDGDLTRLANGQLAFVVFDCLMVAGHPTTPCIYEQRLELARMVVATLREPEVTSVPEGLVIPWMLPWACPTRLGAMSHRLQPVSCCPYPLVVKPIFDLVHLTRYARQVVPNLPLPTDGFVFTHLKAAANPFHVDPTALFKWKPQTKQHNENTIDVQVRADSQPFRPLSDFFTTHRWEKRRKRFWYGTMSMAAIERFRGVVGASSTTWGLWLRLPALKGRRNQEWFCFAVTPSDDPLESGATYECAWQETTQQWVIGRKREKAPNAWDTVQKTLKNIVEDIQLDELGGVN